MKLALHAITITIIQIGIYCWWQRADWEIEAWVNAYYVWEKSVFILLVLCCISPVKALTPFWVVIGIFFVVRLLLEVWSIFDEIGKWLSNYHVIFLINLLCTLLVIRKGKCLKLKQ